MPLSHSIMKIFIMRILQIEKMRHREAQKLARDHLAPEWSRFKFRSCSCWSSFYPPPCCLFPFGWNMCQENNVSGFQLLIIYHFPFCKIIFCIFKHGWFLRGKKVLSSHYPKFYHSSGLSLLALQNRCWDTEEHILWWCHSFIHLLIHSLVRWDHRVLATGRAGRGGG